MKHINESIRDKRGYDLSPKGMLIQGDIVYLHVYPNRPYMYISDMNIIDLILGDKKKDHNLDFSEGMFVNHRYVRGNDYESTSFLVLTKYDDNLIDFLPHGANYSVNSIWRGDDINTKNDIRDIIKEPNLKSLIKKYKKIWER